MASSKKPIIIDEFIPAPGSEEKPWKHESMGEAPQSKAFRADARQIEASKAAQVAMRQGKSKEEVFKAAKDAYESALVEPAGAAPEMDDDVKLRIRWLRAVCRLGSGKFDDCSPMELMDVAMLVDRPVLPFEQWSVGIKGM